MSSYLGNIPSNNFVSLKRQVITGNGGASYTLDHSVASVNDVAIFVNNVRQDPASYSISTTSLTLGGTISSSDSCYVLFLGQALQTVTPDANTITNAMIQDGTIAESKLASGVNTITMADQFRLTTSFVPSDGQDITSNWERADNPTSGFIGTGLTESSGIFTFPQTGIYEIQSTAYWQAPANNGSRYLTMYPRYSTDSGSNYGTYAYNYTFMNANNGVHYTFNVVTDFIDVTDSSTFRLKFFVESNGAACTLGGSTNANLTHFVIKRIGDT
jgi:hypothetical protein